MVKCTTLIDKPFGVDQVTVCRTSDCTGTHAMTDGHTTIAAAKSIIDENFGLNYNVTMLD